MTVKKHLTLTDRKEIESMLNRGDNLTVIAKEVKKSRSSISREIRNHLEFKRTGCARSYFMDCTKRGSCTLRYLYCKNKNCERKYCSRCTKCYLYCKHYEKNVCERLSKPPYVCNHCTKRTSCSLEKRIYDAKHAQKEYEQTRAEARSGIAMSEEEALKLDEFISPLLKNGQSIHHICINNKDHIMYSERSIYNYVDKGLFSARNIDMPRKVRFRKTRKSNHDSFKVDKTCRIGRTYKDYLAYLDETMHEVNVVQIDSVIGTIGGPVLLTMEFMNTGLVLAFLRERNTAASVTEIFNSLYQKLGRKHFETLFQVILADNGSEFSDPETIEFDENGEQRTRVFYCDPSAPYQKGALENSHEYIRRIVPKGTSFEGLTQEKVEFMMDHINSYKRRNLGEKSPYEIFEFYYGKEILEKLGVNFISPNDIILRPALLK